ncbi:BnaCnng11560D [Brassica napus]|uniref:BnaCnng11560D protein n=1 Tax=Brassica napus TaxID=3708 RepID=A0A078I3J5_BRANA|nr:BnaCnng11560D [Brassica napus]
MITCAVKVPETGEQFICSAIYAFNTAAERSHLWREIRETQSAHAHLNLPWVMLGDFNVTLSSSEHSRSLDYRTDQIGLRAFQEVLTDCSLVDFSYGEALFTLWNKRDEDPIGNKLDRALVNGDWLRHFPNSHAYFDAGGVLDHARCLIRLTGIHDYVSKPFRFFNFLAENEEFLPTIQETQSSTARLFHSRTALSSFHKKLKMLNPVLRTLNRTHYGDLPSRTKQAFEELCECQNRVLSDPTAENFSQAAEAYDKWNKLARIEEKFYRQKSCIRWLQAGDQNTSFFHRSVQARATQNTIRRLVTEQGEVLTAPSDFKREAVAHFQRFLQAHEQTQEISIESLQDL